MMLKYFVAILAGGVSVLAMFLQNNFTSPWFFTAVVLLWFLAMISWHLFIYQNSARKWHDLVLLVFTMVGLFSMNLLVEELWLRYLIMLVSGIVFSFLFSRSPLPADDLPHQQKPLRRIVMMIWIFDTFCLFSLSYALNIFFQSVPFSIVILGLSSLVFYINLNVWSNYFSLPWKNYFLWSGVLSLMVAELIWVLHFLTLGYFVLGLLSVWLWYLALLLIRFNLSPDGISWKKQWFFLTINFVCLFVFLFFAVKWL